MDHDTGQDDHSDAIVTDIQISNLPTMNGNTRHMILDKENGILYIADTGSSRILWVNTDDTSTNYQNILDPNWRNNPATGQKDLAEYGDYWKIWRFDWIKPPIHDMALHGDTLLVSENGNGQITATPSPRMVKLGH